MSYEKHMPRRSSAFVIVVGRDRYFAGFGRTGRLIRAWSLAGAKLFADPRDRAVTSRNERHLLKETEQRLLDKGYSISRRFVAEGGSVASE